MIEQSIYFALGCIVTGLLALCFGPLFWRRALRLTRQRLQLQVPLSMQEIIAERDQLRAEFAVQRLRLEQAMARVQATKAHDMAEIGRRSVETTRLNDEVVAARRLEQSHTAEIQHLRRELAEVGAEGNAVKLAYDQAHDQFDAHRRRTAIEVAEVERLRERVQDHRATIASLDTKAMGLDMQLTDAKRSAANREKLLAEAMRGRLETAMAQSARHEVAGVSLRSELDEVKARCRALEAELDAARDREKSNHLQRTMQAERSKGANRAALAELDAMRDENASLKSAGRVAPSRFGFDDHDQDDAGLRASIHALGLAVATMAKEGRMSNGDPPERPVRRKEEEPSPIESG